MKKIKGFSLIECIIAIAILGIASLTMAEIYAGVSRTNLDNHLVNTSLSYQMKMVEQTDSTKDKVDDTIFISSKEKGKVVSKVKDLTQPNGVKITKDTNTTPTDAPHKRSSDNVNCITITKKAPTTATSNDFSKNTYNYSYPVEMYVLLSRDKNDKPSSDSTSELNGKENDINLRYKFIIGAK